MTEPYKKANPGDPIYAQDWNLIQVSARNEIDALRLDIITAQGNLAALGDRLVELTNKFSNLLVPNAPQQWVDGAKIGDKTIGGSKLVDKSIDASKLADKAINGTKIDPAAAISAQNMNLSTQLSMSGKEAIVGSFNGDETWLRLNQAGHFSNGVHTPGLFCPYQLNVGGVSGHGKPGHGNLWANSAGLAGNLAVGRLASDHKFHVYTRGAPEPGEVGLLEASSNNAYLRIMTSDGFDNRVELCCRPGGRLALWVAGSGDVFNINRDGVVYIEVGPNQLLFEPRLGKVSLIRRSDRKEIWAAPTVP